MLTEIGRVLSVGVISTEGNRRHGKFQLLLSSYLDPRSDFRGVFFHSRSLTKVTLPWSLNERGTL